MGEANYDTVEKEWSLRSGLYKWYGDSAKPSWDTLVWTGHSFDKINGKTASQKIKNEDVNLSFAVNEEYIFIFFTFGSLF